VAPLWLEYLAHRRRKGWPVSPLALEGLYKKLETLGGQDPQRWADLVRAALERGWRSIFLPRELEQPRPNFPPGGLANRPGGRPTLNEKYNQLAAEIAAKAAQTDPDR
jgi:hypothetical protein